MGFRIGQKVQCIKRGKWTKEGPPLTEAFPHIWPRYGDILTVRATGDKGQGQHLQFIEIRNPVVWGGGSIDGGEACYLAARFRPLISTNIDIFHSILANPHKELESA